MVRLVTPRLVLRAPTMDDLDALVRLGTDPRVARFPPPTNREATQAWLATLSIRFPEGSRRGVWIAESEGRLVGALNFRPSIDTGELEIGYRFSPEVWGRGLATEAVQAFLALAPGERVIARSHRDNLASRRVMQRSGMALVREYEHEGEPSVEYATTL